MKSVGIATASDALRSFGHVPVEIVRWPEQLDRESTLALEGRLRLVLVPPEVTPPTTWDPRMDWIRLPATDEDVWRRVAGLQDRVRQLPQPELDEFGVLRRGHELVCLGHVAAQILGRLLDKPGAVCSRQRLARSAWPDCAGSAHALNAYIKRLRRQIAPLGLTIRTVRQRGYLLEIHPTVR
jgi:hypothetical protein